MSTRKELAAENVALRADLKTALDAVGLAVTRLCQRHNVRPEHAANCGDEALNGLLEYQSQRAARTTELFRQVYKLAGENQQRAAEMLGVKQPTVHGYLRGDKPGLAVLYLARAIVADAGQEPKA